MSLSSLTAAAAQPAPLAAEPAAPHAPVATADSAATSAATALPADAELADAASDGDGYSLAAVSGSSTPQSGSFDGVDDEDDYGGGVPPRPFDDGTGEWGMSDAELEGVL